MRAGDIARDRQAEPSAGLVLVTRLVKPEERLEDILPLLRRNPRSVVVNVDGQETLIA